MIPNGVAMSFELATYGAVMNKEAIDALKKKYGVVNVEIDNSNIIYASRLVTSGIASSSSSSSRVRPSANVDIKIPAAPGTYKYGVGTLVVTEGSAEYLNLTGTAQNVKLTSDGKTIVINAPLDEIRHYGSADSIIVKAVADASYYGYADADSLEANAGHIVLNSSIDKLSITAEKDMEIDVENDAKVPQIEVGADDKSSIELSVSGYVETVKSSTGSLTFTVAPEAPVVPKLEFTGAEAIKAYESRIDEMLKKKKTFTVNLTVDGKTQSHECRAEYTSKYGTEVDPWPIMGETYDDDVYVDGDFGKIRFIGCTFNGDVINRGSESTIVQFVMCSFGEDSECRIENNGRKNTIDDLVSKFMFMVMAPVNVVCSGSNGSVVSVETANPIIYNGKEHSINDAKYFVDQRPKAYTTAIQKYEGQAAGIYYYGEFNSVDGRKTIDLTVYDSEPKVEDKVSLYRAYITLNDDEVINMDNMPRSYEKAVFELASPSMASISETDLHIKAPYNRVILDGFTFKGTVSVEGLYSKFIFKNCDFGGSPVVIKSHEVEVEFENCKKASPATTGENEIDEKYIIPPDGPLDD